MDPDLRERGGQGGKENTPTAQQREEEKDIDSSPNGAEPASCPKTERMGTGQDRAHLRTKETQENNPAKTTRTPPRPLALTESPGIKMTHVMTEGQAKIKNLVKREKATDEELKSPENV